MPGFEFIGDEERREIQQVLDSGVLMRYGFDGARNGQWKCRELEQRLAYRVERRRADIAIHNSERGDCQAGGEAAFERLSVR